MKATKALRRAAVGITAGLLALAWPMASAGSAQAATGYGATLSEPGVLYPGDYLESGDTRLYMQGDGNFVLYKYAQWNPTPVWAAPGALGCGTKAIMQGDGNLVVYGAGDRICWASDTYKTSSFQTAGVQVQEHGGLKIVFTDTRQWSYRWATIRSSDPY
ncbi:hypothetical protein AB0D10_45505 [Kitasatospora sp. NPDC048545]|uniref:hypothetical protein n=1 Tax=Kitasatospora sp. NPDC048545 TaxID=3157208 RepID=UPI0033DF8A96